MSEFKSIESCQKRLQHAVNQFELKMHAHGSYAGEWKVEITEEKERLQLVWSCEEDDPRVQAMGPDVPHEYRDSGIGSDAPWALWGGNEIIAAAEIGDYEHSGCGCYQQHDISMVSQFVSWNFSE